MRKILLIVIATLIVFLVLRHFYNYQKNQANVIEDVYNTRILGKIELISKNRGFKVKLIDDPNFYVLSGAIRDNEGLVDFVQFGDSLKKDKASRIIYLKSVATGVTTQWEIK